MKKLMFLFAFLSITVLQAFSQTTVSGTVTDPDGAPFPGVTVSAKGTTVATMTGSDGSYSISVPAGSDVLVFSYVGMITEEREVSGATINVEMKADEEVLDEVVVTAVGVTRSEKSLGYAATKVDNDEITKSSSSSAMNSLQGKVAGVQISTSSGAPGASTKVVLRGYSSIGGNNQPLFVVDGVPVDNGSTGSFGVSRSQDFGNRANDINPEDIESVNILKGASATALYGSRAANGVVMITTKKGSQNQKMKVNVTSSADFSEPLRLPQLQNVFGQGWSGHWASDENGSWGPVMDGEMRLWGNTYNNSRQLKPFSPQPNNIKDFFDKGVGYTNSVSFSGGNEKSTFYTSYANVTQDGIVPTDADSYKRNTLSFRGSHEGQRLSADVSVNYVKKNVSAVTTGQGESDGGATLYQELLQIPRDFSIVDFQDYEDNPFNTIDYFYTPYADNPYFVLNENGNRFNEDRMYGNMSLKYNLLPGFNAQWRVGGDFANSQLKDWGAIAKTTPGSPNSSRSDVVGKVTEVTYHVQELNSDFLLTYDKNLTDALTLNLLAGYNVNERSYGRLSSSVSDLTIPEYYNLSNSSSTPVTETYNMKRRLYGVYGQADLGFNDYLYLTFTARNDWSSTLPADNNSFFYPSANLSFVLSDAVPAIKSFLPFAKLRASWGRTGNDAAPYSVHSVMVGSEVWVPFGSINFPFAGVNAFEVSNQIGNPELQPEITSEYELGADLRFFQSRFGIDIAYYDRITDGQLLLVPLAATSGFTDQVMNIGQVQNKGIELMVSIVPVKTKSFNWTVSSTFSNNRNKVLELTEGLEKIVLEDAWQIEFVAMEDHPLGTFLVPKARTDEEGHIVVGPDGVPLLAEDKDTIGSAESQFVMGFTNSMTYKGFRFSFALDWRKGGYIYTYTKLISYFVGNATNTLYNDRNPFIVPNSVMVVGEDDNGDPIYDTNIVPVDMEDVFSYWTPWGTEVTQREMVIDRSYFKLREITLGYTLPKKWMNRVPIESAEIGLYGRNLLVWTPETNNIIDPEVSTFGNDLTGEFGEWGGNPTVRTMGVRVNLKF